MYPKVLYIKKRLLLTFLKSRLLLWKMRTERDTRDLPRTRKMFLGGWILRVCMFFKQWTCMTCTFQQKLFFKKKKQKSFAIFFSFILLESQLKFFIAPLTIMSFIHLLFSHYLVFSNLTMLSLCVDFISQR